MAAKKCVYLSNLPYEAHEAVVQDAFEDESIAVANIQLLKKGSFNRQHNNGLACVALTKASDIERCCRVMDGKLIYGRPMIVRRDKFMQDEPSYNCTAAAVQKSKATAGAIGAAVAKQSLPAGAATAAMKAQQAALV